MRLLKRKLKKGRTLLFPSPPPKCTRFWELESIGILNKEKQPYNYFEENICKNQENPYEVKLPFKENHPLIHDNFQMCKERLLKLHKKVKNDPEVLSQYNEIFEEQRRLGIIETVSEPGKKGKCTI